MMQLERILEKLDDTERAELGSFVHMIHDNLSRNILAKLASPNTLMCVKDLPLEEIGATRSMSVISRLHKFEDMNLVKSEMVKHGIGVYRKFRITPQGIQIAKKYLKSELKRYNH